MLTQLNVIDRPAQALEVELAEEGEDEEVRDTPGCHDAAGHRGCEGEKEQEGRDLATAVTDVVAEGDRSKRPREVGGNGAPIARIDGDTGEEGAVPEVTRRRDGFGTSQTRRR